MINKNYSNWSKEELVREIKKIAKQKKYGILWEDKLEQVALLCKEKLPILAEDKTKEIITDREKPTEWVELKPIPAVILNVYKRIFK